MDVSKTALRTAAALKARLEDGDKDSELRSQLTAWLVMDEMHKRAWDQINETETALKTINGAPEVVALRQETLTRVIASKEVRRQNRKMLAAACMLVLVFGGVAYWGGSHDLLVTSPGAPKYVVADARLLEPSDDGLYETGVGESTEIVLDDGSAIMMDTQSRLSVNFSANERSITLHEGRAMFDVAKNPNRPFSVEVKGRIVTALGTKFDVRSIAGEFEVNLVEGRVKVESSLAEGQGIVSAFELEPGFQAVAASPDETPVVAPVNVVQNTSWERGLLIFDDDTLHDAVTEMNRYSSTQLVLANEKTSQLRLSGAFKAGDNRGFADALGLYFSVEKLTDNDREIVISLAP